MIAFNWYSLVCSIMLSKCLISSSFIVSIYFDKNTIIVKVPCDHGGCTLFSCLFLIKILIGNS